MLNVLLCFKKVVLVNGFLLLVLGRMLQKSLVVLLISHTRPIALSTKVVNSPACSLDPAQSTHFKPLPLDSGSQPHALKSRLLIYCEFCF